MSQCFIFSLKPFLLLVPYHISCMFLSQKKKVAADFQLEARLISGPEKCKLSLRLLATSSQQFLYMLDLISLRPVCQNVCSYALAGSGATFWARMLEMKKLVKSVAILWILVILRHL